MIELLDGRWKCGVSGCVVCVLYLVVSDLHRSYVSSFGILVNNLLVLGLNL